MTRLPGLGRCLRLTFALLMLVSTLSNPALSQDTVARNACLDVEVECAEELQFSHLRTYYRSHARVWLGQEQRLANGVAWRLLIDASTKLATPRITWMADREAVLKANKLFDAIQGALLLEYDSLRIYWRDLAVYAAEQEGSVPLTIPTTAFIRQAKLTALTYATPKMVSYVEVRIRATDAASAPLPEPIGRLLDLDSGKVYSRETCPTIAPADKTTIRNAAFRLGDLFEVCDPDSISRFSALWKIGLEAQTKAAAFSQDPYGEYCKESMQDFDNDYRGFSLYLTATGLAVHNASFFPRMAARECLRYRSAINPVVIPYRELAPFMISGPLKDELLSLATPAR